MQGLKTQDSESNFAQKKKELDKITILGSVSANSQA